MRSDIQTRCDSLAAMKDLLKKTFPWESELMHLAGAVQLMNRGSEITPDQLRACERLIKDSTGIFSELRGNAKIPLICRMAQENDPEAYLTRIREVYTLLNGKRLLENEFNIFAAMTICDHATAQGTAHDVEQTEAIYKQMKKAHILLTSDDDIPYCAVLAVSGLDAEELIAEAERCYALLKKKFHDSDAVQSLSHVLALGTGTAEEKCAKVGQIFDLLKDAKHRFGSGRELATLGTLSLVAMPAEALADAVTEADEALKPHRGFGNFALGQTQRRLLAAQVALDAFGSAENAAGNTILSSLLSAVIAMQMSAVVCISAAVSASAASH